MSHDIIHVHAHVIFSVSCSVHVCEGIPIRFVRENYNNHTPVYNRVPVFIRLSLHATRTSIHVLHLHVCKF